MINIVEATIHHIQATTIQLQATQVTTHNHTTINPTIVEATTPVTINHIILTIHTAIHTIMAEEISVLLSTIFSNSLFVLLWPY